ncbi:MAG TPA: GerMN domain-containing protein [Candidatus Paceibacterota bacterium]|nr:GerMN domain-containing protein [Candidatus Paceibacterota bacterium]
MKTFAAIIGAVLLFGVVAGVVFWERLPFVGDEEQVYCTQDAKLCPDGSYVGRVGPNCEFAACPEVQMRTVSLYYYDPVQDQDDSGNVQCSREGLVSVTREIPVTQTPIQDTIRLLLRGELTDGERAQGITTEYPLSGVELVGAALTNGALTLELNDQNNKTGGGSCRVGILWFQIEQTALQFPEVTSVRFTPEELFQP